MPKTTVRSFLAHSPNGTGQSHFLRDHLQATAALAGAFGRVFGSEQEAALAGLLHDFGKYAERFQERLRNPTIHGVNHWAAGAVVAMNQLSAPLAAYAIDGHHTGLPAASALRDTLLRVAAPNLWREHTGCQEGIQDLAARFQQDGLRLPPAPVSHDKGDFAGALRARMVFSCLVDADFLDTERHFDSALTASRSVPQLQETDAFKRLHDALEAKPATGLVNQLRRRLLADCLAAAEKPSGLFTLTAPTGSGKTLSSLAFALKHIVTHNASLPADDPQRFRRVIVVIPYTSIIEQTAQVLRGLFEPIFGPDYVLEHHSAVAPRERREEKEKDAEEDRLRRARLAAENWASPLVVTTSVQFFEGLFAHKPSDCRKLHRIARSVVLFDEVQTLPPKLIPSLLSVVRLLVRDYGITAVFMTATQPAFGATRASALPYGWEPIEIASNPLAMADTMQRTRIEMPESDERISWPQVAAKLAAHSQALCVVNTTKDARKLFRLLPPEQRFHLSARLCPAHRQEKLALIRERLTAGAPVQLISTQLIEAGVDVDFPVTFRALGPLDSIVQTAGRCNREGRQAEPRPVIIFRPADGKMPPGAYQIAAAKTEEFLARHPQAPLHHPETYARYFAELYALLGSDAANDDPVFVASKAFDFPTAADACRLVGGETHSVLVRWGDGAALADNLRRKKHLTADECRRAQRYSVNLYHEEFREGLGRWIEQPAAGWNFFVWSSNYDDELGACHPQGEEMIL